MRSIRLQLVLLGTLGVLLASVHRESIAEEAGRSRLPEVSLVDLTLQQCIGIALREQPAIRAQAAGVGVAVAQQDVARSHYYPNIAVGLNYTLLDDPVTVDVPNPVTGEFADVVSDAAAFFGIARQAGTGAALAALQNADLPPFSTIKQDVLGQIPSTSQLGLLGRNSLLARVTLAQPLWTGGKIKYRNQQADLGVHVAEIDLTKSHQQTVFEVTEAYLGVQLAVSQAQVLGAGIEHVRTIASVISALIDEGDASVTTTDLHRTRTAVRMLELEHTRVRHAEEIARSALTRAMGVDESFRVRTTALPNEVASVDIDLSQLVWTGLKNRPELAKATVGVRFAELERSLAKAEFAPDVALLGQFATIQDDGGFLNPNDQQREQWAVGLSVGMPIFAGGRRRAGVRHAEHQEAQARYTLRQLRQYVELQIHKAYYEFQDAAERVRIANEARKGAELTVEGYRQQFFGDQITDADMPEYFEDLVETRVLQAQTSAQYNQALYDYHLAIA